MKLISLSDRIIKLGFVFLFALVPLLLTPWNYELFEYNKMMAVYALTVVIVAAWIIKMIAERQIRIARTPLDLPILLFLSSQFISSLFSIDPHVSWFGYYSRFNGGMLSTISYVLLYYAFVSNLTNLTNLSNLLKGALGSAIFVALYGVFERFGIDKHLWVQDVQNRVFSTLGQPNWLAAYLVALSPIVLAFALQQKKRILLFAYCLLSILFFTVLLFTRSRSGLLGFAVADAIFWVIYVFLSPTGVKKTRFISFLFLHAAFFLIVFLNGTHVAAIDRWFTLESWKSRFQPTTVNRQPTTATPSGTLLEYGGTESGKIRNYVWQGAINAWKSSPKTMLIGTGTETFAFAFFRYKPTGHNLTSEWDFLYNKAHNEYLNFLATTGVFGLGSYVLFIGAFIAWFVKNQMSKLKVEINDKVQSSKKNHHLDFGFDLSFGFWILALFAGWISVLITNFFGFSVVVTNLFLFLFPAMIIDKKEITKKINLPKWTISVPLFIAIFLIIKIISFWFADVRFATAYRLSKANQYAQAQNYFDRAISLNGSEPLFHDENSANLAGLAVAAIQSQQATVAATLVKQSLSESDRALSISPKNVNFWKTRTKIFYAFSEFDKEFNKAAIQALEKAAQLSPGDPKIFYNLAILHGREGNNTKSIELLQKTIDLKPNYRDAYYALWVFYNETKQQAKGREVLQTYLGKVDPNDKDFLSRL